MEEKDTLLLIIDLAGRLPYGVKGLVHVEGFTGEYDMYDGSATFDFYPENAELIGLDGDSGDVRVIYLNPGMMDADPSDYDYTIEDFTPYLRPMSSMTEEEKKTFTKLKQMSVTVIIPNHATVFNPDYIVDLDDEGDGLNNLYDWLNANHFDYRGLIEKGLALEAPEDIYKND